jgi:hypothetical protein
MSVDEAGELPAKKIVHRQGRAFLQVQNLTRATIRVDHIAAPLHKDVARQGFKERPLLGRKYGNISFRIHNESSSGQSPHRVEYQGRFPSRNIP